VLIRIEVTLKNRAHLGGSACPPDPVPDPSSALISRVVGSPLDAQGDTEAILEALDDPASGN
jgi:hypothetical protein